MRRRGCCGVHQTGGSIKSRSLVSGLSRMTSCPLRLFVISEYTLMLMYMRTHVAKTVSSCFAVLRHLAVQVYCVVRSQTGHAVTRLCHTYPLGLWKCDTCWIRRPVTRWTAVSPQRCRSFDLHVAQVRSRDAASTRATLAASSREDTLQANSAGHQVAQ